MPPQLVLLIGAVFIFFAFRSDRKRDVGDTTGLFWPSLWYLVVASRPVGVWLHLWGFNLPGGADTDGSIIDRNFYIILTIIGVVILARRRFSWSSLLRANPWLTALFLWAALSILWSQYPYISFKRFIKLIGAVVMAMVVLTSENPLQATATILRRTLYVHLPMSIICTRYFREIGVSFDWSGASQFWQGIATSKNTLGQVAMLGVVYFFWEVRRHWSTMKWRNLHLVYLAMAVYLLKGSEDAISVTSVAVAMFALAVFIRLQGLRERPQSTRRFSVLAFMGTAAIVIIVILHSIFLFSEDSFFGHVITAVGRNITLTDRTFIWNDVYAAAAGDPVLGVGFGGFWIGRIANIPWNEHMTWVLGQAHSGYIDTYLQVGLIGTVLLVFVLMKALRDVVAAVDVDFEFGCLKITLFLTILFINITETTFLRGDHHLWFLMQLVMWVVPAGSFALARSSRTDAADIEYAGAAA